MENNHHIQIDKVLDIKIIDRQTGEVLLQLSPVEIGFRQSAQSIEVEEPFKTDDVDSNNI